MASGKKFYWLKLSKDFFKRHDIKIIESQDNGKDYILFYLKLLVESITHEGELRFNQTIPYDEKMLATITNTNVDVVKQAIKVFTNLKLMEIYDDKTIYMTETAKMLGFETDWARKKRKQRKTNLIENRDNVPVMSPTSPHNVRQEIELEKDIELDIDKELDKDNKDTNVSMSDESDLPIVTSEKIPYSDIANYWNKNSKLKEIVSMTANRKKHINARVKEFGLEKIYMMIDIVSKSSFLRGNNQKGTIWIADFNWCFKNTDNFTKIIEGNFIDDEFKSTKPVQSDYQDRVARLRQTIGG